MKLKRLPEDFQVEELTGVTPTEDGPYALYRLEKEGWTTPDALDAVRRRWNVEWRRVSYGGLKDRHAQTVQHFTIFRGPARNLTHQRIRVQYLGRATTPFTSAEVRANRFRLTLRDLNDAQLANAQTALAEVLREGVPNYFDDQRFGSVSDGRFVAKEMLLGRFEEALRLALVGPYEHDRAQAKHEKKILRAHWGDWQTCQQQLSPGHARRVVDYLLRRPDDFRGALARLPPGLLVLYLAAYQSHLWNAVLVHWLVQHCRPEQMVRIRLQLGEVPMHRGLDGPLHQQLAELQPPLPSARWKPDPDDPRLPDVQAVLAAEGLELAQLRLPGFRDMFFSKGERAALFQPAELSYDVTADDLHAGRQKLVLGFELARGCYATLLVKRITAWTAWL